MRFAYQGSGITMEPGDRILYAGDPGEIEFVVDPNAIDDGLDWYRQESPSGGVMIVTGR